MAEAPADGPATPPPAAGATESGRARPIRAGVQKRSACRAWAGEAARDRGGRGLPERRGGEGEQRRPQGERGDCRASAIRAMLRAAEGVPAEPPSNRGVATALSRPDRR